MLLVAYLAGLPGHAPHTDPPFTAEHAPANDVIEGQWQMHFASDAETPLVHAASMVELPDGRLRAFWFAGSREGAQDVGIHSSVFDPASGVWSEEETVVSRDQVSDGWSRYVRKLGNAVPVLDDNGRMRLFVVAVSFGGWAASRLVVLESWDLGESWQFDRALTASPFLNISTLVKTPPVRYADGSVGLPVYHEMVGKFGEMLRVDQDSRILDKARIGHGRKAIQPLVLVDSPHRATAFLRNESEEHPGMLYRSESYDAGVEWTPLLSSELPNPSAAVGGVALGEGHWLLVANCNAVERDDLCLRETRDGGRSWTDRIYFHNRRDWRGGDLEESLFLNMIDEEVAATDGVSRSQPYLARVEHNKCFAQGCEFQYDYPYVIQARNGDIHVLYTWNKSAIRHAWLSARPPQREGRG